MKRLSFLLCCVLIVGGFFPDSLGASPPARSNQRASSPSNSKGDPSDSEIALRTQTGEIPFSKGSGPGDSLLVPPPQKINKPIAPSAETLPGLDSSASLSLYRLQQISLETLPNQTLIKIAASGGLSKVRLEKMPNPGRLVLEVPQILNATNLSITQLTDRVMVPRIRLAQHPDRLRIIVDTVLGSFPNFNLQKSDGLLVLRLEKTPEILEEAKSKSSLFLAMQRDDREALLKTGSEDEGGILFNDQALSGRAGRTVSAETQGGVKVEPGSGPANRIVFMLDDRKEYKIFIEDTETPIHIRKIRPVFEVKGIQARLKQLGYDVGTEDGSFGPKTREALKQYQTDKGLTVTGQPNRQTQHALKDQFGY